MTILILNSGIVLHKCWHVDWYVKQRFPNTLVKKVPPLIFKFFLSFPRFIFKHLVYHNDEQFAGPISFINKSYLLINTKINSCSHRFNNLLLLFSHSLLLQLQLMKHIYINHYSCVTNNLFLANRGICLLVIIRRHSERP